MKAVFLDFDGVLHGIDDVHAEYEGARLAMAGERLFCHRALLDGVLDRFTGLQLVVSSSWACHYPLGELRDLFGPYASRVIGTTRNVPGAGLASSRFEACVAAAKHFALADWRMLDDDPTVVWGRRLPTPEEAARVIWCEPQQGLATQGVVAALKAWLDGA